MKTRAAISGQNVEELQYVLLHKSASAPNAIPAVEGQFYYNTAAKGLLIRDNSNWKYIPNVGTSLPTTGVLLVPNGITLTPILAPSNNAFVKVNTSAVAYTQRYIGLSDIDPAIYTTAISEPGSNLLFATEKAIVDYVTSSISAIPAAVAGTNTDIQWNNNGVFGASSDLRWNNTTKRALINATDGTGNIHPGFEITRNADYLKIYIEDDSVAYFGTNVGLNLTSSAIILAGTNLLLQSTVINVGSGTASKFLKLDGSKNLTYVDIPDNYITAVSDDRWDLQVNAGTLSVNPFVNRDLGVFYTNDEDPPNNNQNPLLYNGAFYAGEIYEGTNRVMTVHGNQAANGSYHALANSSHNGFLKALPAVNPSTYLLAGNNTWVTATSTINTDITYANLATLAGANGCKRGTFYFVTDKDWYLLAINDNTLIPTSGVLKINNGDTLPAWLTPETLLIDTGTITDNIDGTEGNDGITISIPTGYGLPQKLMSKLVVASGTIATISAFGGYLLNESMYSADIQIETYHSSSNFTTNDMSNTLLTAEGVGSGNTIQCIIEFKKSYL